MDTITSSVTIRALRGGLADAVGRANYGHERVQITKNGKPAAVLIGPEDFELLEQLEMHRDVAEYRAAKAADAGERVSLDELLSELTGSE
ncbi:type II toxin-antitoxin system Phd/YefM family antitoxin [Cryobacterium sp. Hh11]|uniref:type II toxin-antitoxin system Phd/YefM family antitoxin n=1 Tax=Cryobacterium sp. Hh11 TaxID=2555868 RepID=UPI00106C6138|nr:type II toxin-antitoxin system Phd/YefM family antitoxin [Cryobacterium sp. Hh11]TFD52372.1 type II toxin-antitoxin system Phd/YefM family antitoxin [Cryobacterium sp. Hh11]